MVVLLMGVPCEAPADEVVSAIATKTIPQLMIIFSIAVLRDC